MVLEWKKSNTALEWAMSELLRHPHAMKRLREEIESVVGQHRRVKESDLGRLKYLHYVVMERLSLYPLVPLAVPHQSREDVTVTRYATVWEADALPEKFMQEEYVVLTGQSDFKMFPFGSGRRGCPGHPMAILMIEIVLAD